jgi:hypothetical protein
VGYQAGVNSNGNYNTYIGNAAGLNRTSGTENTCVGSGAGAASGGTGTGTGNTLIGNNAGTYITSGAYNTVIGAYNGNQGGLNLITASNYIVLSDGAGNPRAYCNTNGSWQFTSAQSGGEIANFSNTSATPYGFQWTFSAASPNNTGQYFVYAQDSTALRINMRSNGGIANYQANDSNLSDRREKTNFAPAGSYLDKICAIPVQTFKYIDQTDDVLTLGVVAQDVQAVAPELVSESDWAKQGDEPKMRLSIYQTDFQYALMKALQELKAEFDAYKATHP